MTEVARLDAVFLIAGSLKKAQSSKTDSNKDLQSDLVGQGTWFAVAALTCVVRSERRPLRQLVTEFFDQVGELPDRGISN